MIALSPGGAFAIILAALAFIIALAVLIWKVSRPSGEALLMKAAAREYRLAAKASRKGRMVEAGDHMEMYYKLIERVDRK